MTSSKGRRRADSSGSTMSAAGSEAGSVGGAVEGNAADLRVLSQLRSLKVSKQELAPPSSTVTVTSAVVLCSRYPPT